MNLKLLSIWATAILIGSVLALGALRSIFGTGPITIAIQIAAGVLMVWARLTFGMRSFHPGANPTEGGLVTSGPYRYLRHPIYAAILYFLWAGVAAHFSLRVALLGLLATAMLGVRMWSEETFLGATYPEYAEYSRKTGRVVPFLF